MLICSLNSFNSFGIDGTLTRPGSSLKKIRKTIFAIIKKKIYLEYKQNSHKVQLY